MRLLVIVGSSRSYGVSGYVVSLIRHHIAEHAAVDVVWLKDHSIRYCDADNACAQHDCGIDDGVGEIIDRMVRADAIIYMPVMHAFGTNSRFQAFLERTGYGFLRPRCRPLKDRLAAVVVVGRRYGHTSVFAQVALNVMLNKMVLVGAGFPPTFHSQFEQDREAELALKDTLDRMIEHYRIYQRAEINAVGHARIMALLERQTG